MNKGIRDGWERRGAELGIAATYEPNSTVGKGFQRRIDKV